MVGKCHKAAFSDRQVEKCAFVSAASSLDTINGLYGGTLVIPCNTGAIKAEDILITKWKYVSRRRGQQLLKPLWNLSDTHLSQNHAPSECMGCTLEHASVLSGDTEDVQQHFACFDLYWKQHHAWQALNKSTLFCSQGQRRRAFRRPASQAEEPEHLDHCQRWIQRPREHGSELQSAAVRCQADRSEDVHLHGGGWSEYRRVPGQHSGL